MPKIAILDKIARAIESALAVHASGLAIRDIEAAFLKRKLAVPRRSLQRQLDALLLQNRIERSGAGRSLIYKLSNQTPALSTDALALPSGTNTYPALSPAGLEIRQLVNLPITQRKPVGYQRDFLERYRPNVDFYLPQSTRLHLREIGRIERDDRLYRDVGTYARDVYARLLIDLSWASSRLEGNTYTRLDTQRLIEEGLSTEGKAPQETQMILNHKAAIELLLENSADIGFNSYTILNLHALLSDNLLADASSVGALRTRQVEVSGTTYLPLAVPQIIAEQFQKFLRLAQAIQDPFEQAFFGMVHIPYLQAFEDVNKRVSRLAANIALIQNKLCPLSFIDLSEQAYTDATLGVYELNRTELLRDVFVSSYERSCQRYLATKQSIGEPDAFRLMYRTELQQVMQTMVRSGLSPAKTNVLKAMSGHIPKADQLSMLDVVQTELKFLSDGNIARYRLSLKEFRAWAALHQKF
jgi:Fic family protein